MNSTFGHSFMYIKCNRFYLLNSTSIQSFKSHDNMYSLKRYVRNTHWSAEFRPHRSKLDTYNGFYSSPNNICLGSRIETGIGCRCERPVGRRRWSCAVLHSRQRAALAFVVTASLLSVRVVQTSHMSAPFNLPSFRHYLQQATRTISINAVLHSSVIGKYQDVA